MDLKLVQRLSKEELLVLIAAGYKDMEHFFYFSMDSEGDMVEYSHWRKGSTVKGTWPPVCSDGILVDLEDGCKWRAYLVEKVQ